MSSIDSAISIYDPSVRAIDLSKQKLMHISEASEEVYQSFVQNQERFLEAQYSSHSYDANSPRHQDFATIEVNGKTVATIDNNGFVASSNALGGKINKLLSEDNSTLSGPQLAQDRAAKIADLLGGTVVKSATALSQSEYNAHPKPETRIDHQAMQQDPSYLALQKVKEARTLYLTQQIAQDTAAQNGASNNVTLNTSKGREVIDLDAYFSPKGPVNLDDVPLILPSAENINSLRQHGARKFEELLKAYDIPEGPAGVSFDNEGHIQIPANYAYKDELTQALDENPTLMRELSTINALTSHYVGMQSANRSVGYAKITLDFDTAGDIIVKANGTPYAGQEAGRVQTENAQAQNASNQYAQSSSQTEEADETQASTAEEWFREYMEKTPAQRYYEALLREKGLTPEELDALPPEERLKIEEEIQAKMKERANPLNNNSVLLTG